MWFSKSIEEVLTEFRVDPPIGLEEQEAKARLEKYGRSKLKVGGRKGSNLDRLLLKA